MDKALYHRPPRGPQARLLRLATACASLSILFLNIIGCSVQRDPARVQSATLKASPLWLRSEPGARGAVTAFNPAAKPLVAAAAVSVNSAAPVLLEESGEAPLASLAPRNTPSKRLLPPLYLESDPGKQGQLTYVDDASRSSALQTSYAPSSLRLDSYEIQAGGELTGTFFQPLDMSALHLLWIDEAGRVCAEQPALMDDADAAGRANTEQAPHSFRFKMPAATFGQRHKLALVRLGKARAKSAADGPVAGAPNENGTSVEAVESFRVVDAFSWDDYAVVSRDDSARRLFPAHAVRLEMALQNSENPLLLANWDATVAAFAKSRDPKLLERQPSLLNEAAMSKALLALSKNFSAKTTGLNLWSLGDGAELTHFAAPFDFDQSPEALEDYRLWLRDQRYGSLKSLNAEWKSDEKDWGKINPAGTDALKSRLNRAYASRLEVLKKGDPDKQLERRGDDAIFTLLPKDLRAPGGENLAAWADFRAYNDYAFASVLNVFRKRAAELDPRPRCGLTGLLAPAAWGGWSYDNLARALSWAEEHDSVIAREILRGYSSSMGRDAGEPIHMLTQVSSSDPVDIHRIYDRWLRGDNGCLLASQSAAAPVAPPSAAPAGAPGNAATVTPLVAPAPAIPAIPTPAVPPLDDISELTRGLTLLRNHSIAQSDPIAIYYSPRSVYLHWILDTEEEGSEWLNRDARAGAVRDGAALQMKAWLMLLEDLGYAPHFIDPEIAAGGLHFPETKILILPKVLSLSSREAQVIKAFARAGGCVIADGECGTFDGAGRRRGPLMGDAKGIGALDAEFGIARKDFRSNERNGRFRGESISARLTIKDPAGHATGPDSPELRVLEPGVLPAGATAHASTPGNIKALFGNLAREKSGPGKGHYYYLNLCLMDYPRLRAERTAAGFAFNGLTSQAYAEKYGAPTGGEALRLVLSDILEEFAGENPLTLRLENGTAPRGLKRASFDLGHDARFMAFFPLADFSVEGGRDVLSGAPLSAALDAYASDTKPHFWYDMRAGEFLGSGDEAKFKLLPNRPALLAALPYSADKLVLQVRRINQSNIFKINATLQCSGGTPGLHVFHFEVADTKGNVMPWYAVNQVAENGSCVHEIAIAINAPAGIYHVKVRDVLTGRSAENDLPKESVEFDGLNFDENQKPR